MRNNPPLPAITGDVIRMVVTFFDTKASGANPKCRFDWMGLVFAGTGLNSDVNAFPTAFQTLAETTLKAVLPPTATIGLYQAQAVSRNDIVNAELVGTTFGTAGVNSLPSNAAAVIKRGTTVKGQHGRGRVSLPFVPDTFTTPATATDVLNATARTAYAAFIAAAWGTGVTPASITVNGRTYIPAITQTPPPGPNLVTLASPIFPGFVLLDPIVGSVRNRARKRR